MRHDNTTSVKRPRHRTYAAAAAIGAVYLLATTAAALAQDDAGEAAGSASRSVLQIIQAGGVVGYAIMLLSVVGIALVIDAFFRLRQERLVPPALTQQITDLSQRGRFTEVLEVCRSQDNLLARILASALPEGHWGVDAVREAVQQEGEKQVTALRQRVGYIGLIAAIAPLLGLLGTVVGMIRSFQVLGAAQGAARPDELAVGISEALVTTCMGLILAMPLLFFHAYLRDRVTRIGQDASGVCERMLRIMDVVVRQRQGQARPQSPNPPAASQSA